MLRLHYKQIPFSFLFEHQATLAGLGKIGLKSLKLTKGKSNDWQYIPTVYDIIAPPSEALIDHYIQWSGAKPEKYQDCIPPHMVSQWGLSFGTRLLLKTSYSLSQIINQGVALKINGKIPRGEKLLIQANIIQVDERNGLARLSVQIVTGTVSQPNLVETILHVAFILSNFQKNKRQDHDESQNWELLGQWSVSDDDGLKFALLTGDFNPIHWIGPLAKFSNFGQKVLHGFGVLAKSYECIPVPIKEIDVRFLKPVTLPSRGNRVEHAVSQDKNLIRVVGSKGQICLLGQYS